MTSKRRGDWAEIEWIDGEGESQMWRISRSATLPALGHAQPILISGRAKHQNHIPGSWYSYSTAKHIPYFSQLERRWLLMTEFDFDIAAIVSQPFRVHVHEADSRVLGYVPDFLVIETSGDMTALEVKPERFDDEQNQRRVQMSTPHLLECGIDLQIVHEPDPQTLRNVEFLSHFRRPNLNVVKYRSAIQELATNEVALSEIFGSIGPEVVVRPAVFHMLWHRELEVDVAAPLSQTSVVRSKRQLTAAAP